MTVPRDPSMGDGVMAIDLAEGPDRTVLVTMSAGQIVAIDECPTAADLERAEWEDRVMRLGVM